MVETDVADLQRQDDKPDVYGFKTNPCGGARGVGAQQRDSLNLDCLLVK